MAADLYATLGVAKDADADTIRTAYRRRAKQHHPDLNPGNKAAEEKFKTVSAANEILSDPEKRARYDRGEIDASGGEPPQRPPWRDYADAPGGRRYSHAETGPEAPDYSDIFADFFGRGGPANMRMRGDDLAYTLRVSFLDAVNGATTRLALPDGRTIDVRIPPGIENEQVLRLKGQGEPGRGEAPAGDALIRIEIEPHRLFRREGNDILAELPVTLAEALLGGKISVPTTTGPVAMSVPAKSNTGTKLRLRGRGVPAHGHHPAGDQFITLQIVLDPADAGLAAFLRDRRDAPAFDPRHDLGDRP